MWVDQDTVPSVIAYGVYDKVCPFDSVKHLANALEENGVTLDYFELPHSGHALQNDTKLYGKSYGISGTIYASLVVKE